MVKRSIKVQFEVEFLHRFLGAANTPALAEVAYLQHPHQHYGRITVWMQTAHNDREVEFQLFRRWLRGLYGTEPVDFGERSCETIAVELHAKIAAKYPRRAITVEVSEDGVCGAVLEFE